MRALLIVFALVLSGCSVSMTTPQSARPNPTPSSSDAALRAQAEAAADQFEAVVTRMEPVAEAMCRERRRGNCDFLIAVDSRPGQPPNAFQTVNAQGRPILAFNIALIAAVRNEDELAFVVGHEAAHHIADHLDRQQQNAAIGAQIFGEAASSVFGSNAEAIRAGQELGAVVGSRTYSKEFELEADALGTVITHRAGFDPVRGAAFFNQLPDPQNQFLGTHPPNAQRIETVRRVSASLGR